MVEQIFQSLVAGTLLCGALFLTGMVECQLRSWRKRQRDRPDLLKRKLLTDQVLPRPELQLPDRFRGYDSPEIFERDESVRREKDLYREN